MTPAQAALRMEQASRLVAGADLPRASELTAEATRALGWALKDLCYASWSSEPQAAVRAAATLRRLRDAAADNATRAEVTEVDALVAWTQGIASVIDGDMEAAATSLDAAAAVFAGLGQPGQAAQTQVPKIMALAMLGRDDEAARCAEAAQRALIDSGDLRTAGKVLLNLGNLHLRSDRHGAAAERLREAAALFSRIGDAEHSAMAENGLADALTALGDLDAAASSYARALAASQPYPVLQALVQESMALLDLVRGRYREALAGLEGSRQRYAALQMPQHLAIAEKQLADVYLDLRLLPESIAAFEAALDRFRELEMEVDRAWTLVQRGRALALAGRPASALASLNEAATLFSGLDNTAGAAAVALVQAEIALGGKESASALALARTAAAGFQRAGLAERQLRAQTLQAQALLRAGAVAPARELFDQTLEAARGQQFLPVQLRCLSGRAEAALALGDRSAARQDLLAAVELFEDQRQTLPGEELRRAFQGDHLLPFELLLRLSLDAHLAGHAAAGEVLSQLDRCRARTLADRLGADEPVGGADDGDASTVATQALRARLAWQTRRLRRLHDEGAYSAALSTEMQVTERELLERARRARLSMAAGAAPAASGCDSDSDSDSGPAGLDIVRLQGLLEPGDALVEYGVQDDELFACVVTHQGVELQRHMAAWTKVVAAMRSLRFQIDTLRHGGVPVLQHLPTLEQRVRAHLQHMHTLVWQPLLPLLGKWRRVMIVPHGQLASVPFAALHDGRHFVVDHGTIGLAPSAHLALHALSRGTQNPMRVLALGESARLPHAAREARTVAGLLPFGQAFVGPDATLANLRAHARNANVIHLACHAQFRTDNPVFSALHLVDEVLTAESIESLHLPAALVVLSGCETALGDESGGDEMLGLTRAFLIAGASRVLASLWPVDDATTAELMAEFYGGLRRGQPPAAALRQAQLIARQRRPHPFYWAPFSMMGRW